MGALAAPAQAGYKSHFGHGHFVKKHYFKHSHFRHYHKFHAYRHVYKPVCVKYGWAYSYGHKTWKCLHWH